MQRIYPSGAEARILWVKQISTMAVDTLAPCVVNSHDIGRVC